MLHNCGVFLVFDLNTKINPFIKNFYEKLAFNFSMFKQNMNIVHCTVHFFFSKMNRVVDLTWYTGEGGGGQKHGFLHGLELEPLLVVGPSLGQNLSH